MVLEREFKMLFIHISLLRELHLDPSFYNVFNVIWLFCLVIPLYTISDRVLGTLHYIMTTTFTGQRNHELLNRLMKYMKF